MACSDAVVQEALRVGCKRRQRKHLPTPANSFEYGNNHSSQPALPMPKLWDLCLILAAGDQEQLWGGRRDLPISCGEAARLAPGVSPNASPLLICSWSWSWTFTAGFKRVHRCFSSAGIGPFLGMANWKSHKLKGKWKVEEYSNH